MQTVLMADHVSEMRLFDPSTGDRLYMDEDERRRFLVATTTLDNIPHRMFCEVLHWTGCRISEALALTPRQVNTEKRVIRFRTLKKRKRTRQGELKGPVFRDVPIPKELAVSLDLVFEIRKIRKTGKGVDLPLWPNQSDCKRSMDRSTGWRVVKRVLDAAGIQGPQATPKGFRHGFAVAMILGGLDYRILQQRLGHEQSTTTAIYLQVVGHEAHDMQMDAWDKANRNWGV
ncbi:MAG: site-specific integrase [Candidatus Thiodiazotropha sp.]